MSASNAKSNCGGNKTNAYSVGTTFGQYLNYSYLQDLGGILNTSRLSVDYHSACLKTWL